MQLKTCYFPPPRPHFCLTTMPEKKVLVVSTLRSIGLDSTTPSASRDFWGSREIHQAQTQMMLPERLLRRRLNKFSLGFAVV